MNEILAALALLLAEARLREEKMKADLNQAQIKIKELENKLSSVEGEGGD